MTEVVGFRLSPQQRRLWDLADGPAYRAQCALWLEGPLALRALEKALAALVARHQILRTALARQPGVRLPLQSVFAAPPPAWTQVDLRGRSPDEHRGVLEDLLERQGARSVDLGNSWRLEPLLVRLEEERHALVLRLPAFCADRWTLRQLPREIGRLYRISCEGSPDLEEPVQYVHFSEWLHEVQSDPEAEPGLRHWQQQVAAWDPALPLPLGRAAADHGEFRLRSVSVAAPRELAAALEQAARHAGVPPEDFLLAAWRALLWRLTAVSGLAIGWLADGRKYDELAETHGLFARFLPLCIPCDDDTPFDVVLRQVHEQTGKGRQWQELFTWPEPPAGDGRLGYFAAAFEHETEPMECFAAGVRFSLWRTYACFDRFKVELACRCHRTELDATIHYDADALSAADAEQLAARFLTLATAAANRPETPLGSLDALSSAESRTLIRELNATGAELPFDRPLHVLFSAQAARTPEATAIVTAGGTIAYHELAARANRLAHHLLGLGVGPDVRVAICCERSAEMVVGLLATLKAGGAYVPIDATYPPERIAWLLDDCGAAVLLTRPELMDRLAGTAARVVRLDEGAGGPERDPAVRVDPDNLAYVIYTSGSTGRPKGVMVTHRGLSNYLLWAVGAYGLAPGDAVPVHSPVGFDLTVTSLWGPLLVGGKVWLLSEEGALEELADHLSAGEEPALVKLTPSHLEVLRELWLPGGRGRAARVIVLGGEALEGSSLAGWGDRLAGVRIVNEYGPTETVVGCCVHEVLGGDELGRGPVPIGGPIANLRLYAVNPHLKVVPLGVPGELLIGGVGVARGYLGRPDLTAERFVPDPFGEEVGGRLYRSGDRVRYRPDGSLEYLGRLDDQVKIRGFRVEPGEIAEALRGNPGVADAAVIAHEDEPGRRRLVAYVIPSAQETPDATELRAYLARSLPEHMLPSAFVALRSWPLTPNGKLDRRALPKPGEEQAGAGRGFAPPRTPEERTLAEIWAQVLGMERVGVHDNFFQLGGDSILGVQAVARAQRRGLRLTPGQLFRHQTIAELAAAVAERAETPAAEQGVIEGPVPLTPIQRWFFELGLARPQHWNQAVLLEVRQPIAKPHVQAAVEALLAGHDALRLRFQQDATAWSQAGTEIGEPVSLLWRNLAGLSREAQAAAIEEEAGRLQASLDLGRGPLLRAAWFTLGPDRPARLLLVAHHLCVDAVSWRILLADLERACAAAARGAAIDLPPKTSSYRAWARRLEEMAASEAVRFEVEFWLRRGSTAALPRDGIGGPNDRTSEEVVQRALDAGATGALLQELPRVARAQPHEVLVAALVQAFARWAGEEGLLLELEGHGREELDGEGFDLSRTVGWFTSLYPAELRVGAETSPGEALRAIKEQLRRIPRHGLGFGILRYLGDPEIAAALAALPRPAVGFNYLGRLDRGLAESALFAPAGESVGPLHDPAGERPLPIELAAAVLDGQLQIRCRYSRNLNRRESIEALADTLLDALRALIAYGRSPGVDGYAPSDFPRAQLSETALERVAGLLDEIDRAGIEAG